MKKVNQTTTHISTTQEVKEMLRQIAEKEERTMRKVLERVIKKEYERAMKK